MASRVIPDIEIGPAVGRNLASPKSSSFDAGLRQHDVGGLEIAMDDALAMRLVERVGDLDGDLQRLVERERPFLEARGQRLALEMRHDQVVRAIDAADVVDAADVGMVQRGDRPGLALEACPRIGIAGDVARQDLDGDRAIEARVAGLVDLAHPAGAERRGDLIRAEPGAWGSAIVESVCGFYSQPGPTVQTE